MSGTNPEDKVEQLIVMQLQFKFDLHCDLQPSSNGQFKKSIILVMIVILNRP